VGGGGEPFAAFPPQLKGRGSSQPASQPASQPGGALLFLFPLSSVSQQRAGEEQAAAAAVAAAAASGHPVGDSSFILLFPLVKFLPFVLILFC
jgi:hypothetical protein